MDKLTSKRGMMMLLSLFVVAFSGLYVTVGMTRAMTETRVSQQFLSATSATQLAEATVDQVLYLLRMSPVDLTMRTGSYTSGAIINTPSGRGWLTNVSGGPTATPPVWRFTANGQTSTSAIVKKLMVAVQVPPASSGGGIPGIFGGEWVQVNMGTSNNGNSTIVEFDSYDSSLPGGYNPATARMGPSWYDVIRTDDTGTSSQPIQFRDAYSEVWGNILVAPGNPTSDAWRYFNVHQNGGSLGVASALLGFTRTVSDPGSGCPAGLSSWTTPQTITAPITMTICDVNLNSENITVAGTGNITVFVRGIFKTDGTSSLSASGVSRPNVKFVILGRMDLTGTGTYSIQNDPTKLSFEFYDSSPGSPGPHVNVTPTSSQWLTFYGQIYAPYREVNVTQGKLELFGGIAAKRVELTNGGVKIHADRALSNAGGSTPFTPGSATNAVLKFWRETT